MKILRIIGISLVMLMFLSIWQTAQAKGTLSYVNGGRVYEKLTTLKQHALTSLLALHILGTASISAIAHEVPATFQHDGHKRQMQGNTYPTTPTLNFHGSSSAMGEGEIVRAEEHDAEDVNAAWSEDVEEMGKGVFYMAARNRGYEHMHHLVYIGDTETREPMFAGLFLRGHENDYIRLYSQHGLVAQGFEQREIMVFPDPLDLYAEVTVFTIKNIDISDRYEPIMPEMYPFEGVGAELKMLQYTLNRDDPESYKNLVLRERSNCEIIDPMGWGRVQVGMHTCASFEGALGSYGAPLLLGKKVVNFYGGSNGENTYFAEGMSLELIDFINGQQINPTAVISKGKLATTWGEIKNSN